MKLFRIAYVVVAMAATTGCAAVALTAGGIAGGAGVEHTLSGIAYKTFNAPLADVRRAAVKTLRRMEIEVTKDGKSEEGWAIDGVATQRRIGIELEAVTPRTTRMRVVVEKGGIFFKDNATGTEIIIQTAERIEARAQR